MMLVTLLEKVMSLKLLAKMPTLVKTTARVRMMERSLMVRAVAPAWGGKDLGSGGR
jgi:hypothetical protein